jgi:hypothetical protein
MLYLHLVDLLLLCAFSVLLCNPQKVSHILVTETIRFKRAAGNQWKSQVLQTDHNLDIHASMSLINLKSAYEIKFSNTLYPKMLIVSEESSRFSISHINSVTTGVKITEYMMSTSSLWSHRSVSEVMKKNYSTQIW